MSTSDLIVKHGIVKKKSFNDYIVKGIWANIKQVCICMAGIVSGWVMNQVNGEEKPPACWHSSNQKGWTCCVNGPGEAPHPCWLCHSLILQTAPNAIDKSSTTHHACVCVLYTNTPSPGQYIQTPEVSTLKQTHTYKDAALRHTSSGTMTKTSLPEVRLLIRIDDK